MVSKIFQLYNADQFYWCRKSDYTEKSTDLQQVTEQLYHIMLHRLIIKMLQIFCKH